MDQISKFMTGRDGGSDLRCTVYPYARKKRPRLLRVNRWWLQFRAFRWSGSSKVELWKKWELHHGSWGFLEQHKSKSNCWEMITMDMEFCIFLHVFAMSDWKKNLSLGFLLWSRILFGRTCGLFLSSTSRFRVAGCDDEQISTTTQIPEPTVSRCRWWQLNYFLIFTPTNLGKIPILTHIFSIVLVQPPTTPRKINMEPPNHPFRKENDLPNLQGIMFHVNLPGCRLYEGLPSYISVSSRGLLLRGAGASWVCCGPWCFAQVAGIAQCRRGGWRWDDGTGPCLLGGSSHVS